MKADIHPKYVECSVRCACGSTFTTKSVRSEIKTDICSECHPYYTGAQKFIDTAGRVDKFRKRYAKTQAAKAEAGTTEVGTTEVGTTEVGAAAEKKA